LQNNGNGTFPGVFAIVASYLAAAGAFASVQTYGPVTRLGRMFSLQAALLGIIHELLQVLTLRVRCVSSFKFVCGV
jgi:hypothetical protein